MNHHLLDCNIIVREPNGTRVQLAAVGREEVGRELWSKAQVTGMIDELESPAAERASLM